LACHLGLALVAAVELNEGGQVLVVVSHVHPLRGGVVLSVGIARDQVLIESRFGSRTVRDVRRAVKNGEVADVRKDQLDPGSVVRCVHG
jgi:hypothetical protein